MRQKNVALQVAGILLVAQVFSAQARSWPPVGGSARQLADLSLEELGNIEVTSVSGRAENIQNAAASIYVITQQDIRRSGANSLPEALRLAPNLQVAQTSSGQWAISARGFQDLIANKLLVIVDGRTIYSALFAGVFWDSNDVALEDIDHIEVISGPGGTIWGANAVNGVINVVTRNAANTQGTILSVTRSRQGGREVARWGARVGEQGYLRVYALAVDRGNTSLPGGSVLPDDTSRDQAGFRGDWAWGASTLTVQGDAYKGGDLPANSLAPLIRGGNIQARWRSTFADGSAYTLQAIRDVANRNDVDLFINRVTATDLQFRHEVKIAVGQLLWGTGYRTARDTNAANALVRFTPAERQLSWANVFAQYQWPVARRLQLTAGLKLERNSYTGVESLPSVRLAWEHSDSATTWAAASRAVRAPARIDRDFFFPGAAPFQIAGGPNFESEVANVYEIGHRAQLGKDLQWSGTLFRNEYKGLRSGVPGAPLPATVQNLVQGHIQGLETWGAWQATPSWRLTGGFLAMQKRLHYCCDLSPATTSFPGLGVDPSSQWSLRSSHDFGNRIELDVMARRVGALSAVVPSYTAFDAQLAKQVTPKLRVALIARNLLDARHVEYLSTGAGGAPDSEFGRRLMLQARWDL